MLVTETMNEYSVPPLESVRAQTIRAQVVGR